MEPPSVSPWSSDLRLARTDRTHGTTCLTVDGDVDMVTGDHFRETVMALVADPAVLRLFIDLTGLSFIDSNGVTVLIKAHRAAGERGIPLRHHEPPDTIGALLEVLGVYDILTKPRVE